MIRFKQVVGVTMFIGIAMSGLRAQLITVDGYAFESGNRGYLNEVKISIAPKADPERSVTVYSNTDGFFTVDLAPEQTYVMTAEKALFHPTTQDLSSFNASSEGKVFAKIQLNRKPGYLFDVTLAEERLHPDSASEGITGALIEIYNNTTKEEELVLKDYPDPNFAYTFQKGNHYTLLIRKKGFFSKRLEAYVDVETCILCFDGLAAIENVTDNLTEGLTMGSLLANIELKRATIGSTFTVENIFYDLNKSEIRPDAAAELDKLVAVLKDNRTIKVELGSHTDSRGDAPYNANLSKLRAESAVAYLVSQGLNPDRIVARGYGETSLKNRCADGVQCPESEHQENRRTEVKVLDISGYNLDEQKSLADIKHEENFEKMLAEIQTQETVIIEPGDEMPEDLKRQIEATKRAESGLEDGDLVKESVPVREPLGAENTVDLEKSALVEEKDNTAVQDADEAETTQQQKPSATATSDLKPVRDPREKPVLTDFDEEAQREKAILDVVGLSPKRNKTKAIEIPQQFAGFMIEIKKEVSSISNDDKLFTIYGDIFVERLPTGEYSYLIAGFESFDECYIFFEENILEEHPNAKIIEFISGSRL